MTASAARTTAREVLTRVRESSSYAHEVLNATLKRSPLSPEDTGLATRLAYGALQTEGTLDGAIDRYLGGKRIEPRLRDALRISAYEILFLNTADRAAVHQGVELARSVRVQAAGLANAVLRRLSEDAPEFPWGDPAVDDAALARLLGHPEWLTALWVSELGRDMAAAVMSADNEPAPLFLAVNPFVGSSGKALSQLEADGAKPKPCALPGCFIAGDGAAAVRGKALADGLVLATDAAAQLVSLLVHASAGQRIVEVGAGRGTKTLLLQAGAVATGDPAHIDAVDLHDFKVRLLEARLARFGVPGVTGLVGDATDFSGIPGAPQPGTVDAVLVDAPCSGLGTLRRHPEKRWRVTPEDVASLGQLGGRLLAEASRLVRSGGFVVYSTCTLTNAENADVVHAFLTSEPGRAFHVDPLAADVPQEWHRFITSEGFFRSVPEPGGPDGHFAARLVRV